MNTYADEPEQSFFAEYPIFKQIALITAGLIALTIIFFLFLTGITPEGFAYIFGGWFIVDATVLIIVAASADIEGEKQKARVAVVACLSIALLGVALITTGAVKDTQKFNKACHNAGGIVNSYSDVNGNSYSNCDIR